MPFPLKVPQGYHIGLFAHDLGAVRDLQISPEGILVASVTSGGKVLAFTDENSDGIADETHLLLSNIRKPHGLAFYKGYLYVASELAVTRYKWNASKREAVFDKTLFDIPAGGRHFTRSITFNSKGVMFVSIGSTCDTCNENHPWYAAVITSDMNGKSPLLYASGLRNSPFIIRDRAYAKNMPDSKCANTKSPVYEIPSHSAPLGLTFIPAEWESMKGNLLVGYHGSWNRSVPAGYKVVYLSVNKDGVSNGADFITGFIEGSAAYGRPVDVEFDKHGDLFVSDDKAGNIYIVTKQ
jgi:glucose/arabinose dehydrogenase